MSEYESDDWLSAPDVKLDDQAKSLDLTLAVFGDDDLQAELIAAGAFVKFGSYAIKHAQELEPKHFRDLNIRYLIEASLAIVERGDVGHDSPSIFPDLVQTELDRRGVLSSVGGPAFVNGVWINQAPGSPDVVAYWSRRVISAWQARELVQLLGATQHEIDKGGDIWVAISKLREAIDLIVGDSPG